MGLSELVIIAVINLGTMPNGTVCRIETDSVSVCIQPNQSVWLCEGSKCTEIPKRKGS